jgi:hypothetical protein
MYNRNHIDVAGDTHFGKASAIPVASLKYEGLTLTFFPLWRSLERLPTAWRVCSGKIFRDVLTGLNEAS